MFDLRLITIIGLLTLIVIVSLVLEYLRLLRRPARLGLSVAILCMLAGFVLILKAVLPDNQFYGPVFTEVKTDKKVVALTFDDGPYPPYTGQILDILKENSVPATFFVIGQNAQKYPELVRRIAAEGHQIGNHTYRHTDLLKVDREAIEEEIDLTNKTISDITGRKVQAFRPPHGFRDAVVMDVTAERHLKVVEWSVSARDWTEPGTDEIVKRTVANVRNGSVILLHDGDGVAQRASRAQTVQAVGKIIRELSARGYKFVTVNEIVSQTEE